MNKKFNTLSVKTVVGKICLSYLFIKIEIKKEEIEGAKK
jgi:hypothetical protein